MAITEYQITLGKMLPNKPPEDALRFAEEKKILDRHAIVYRVKPGRPNDIQCTCSSCGGSFETLRAEEGENCRFGFCRGVGYRIDGDVVFNGKYTHCPLCGTALTAYHCSEVGKYGDCLQSVVLLYFTVIDGNAAAVSWMWRRILYKDGHEETEIHPDEAYVFVKRRCYRFTGWYKCFMKILFLPAFEPCGRCTDEIGQFNPEHIVPFKKNIFDGTVLENAKLKRYLKESYQEKIYPITYLRSFQQHPQVENLIMQGLSKLYNDIIYANGNHWYTYETTKIPTQGICWRGRKPADLLDISTEQFRAARAQRWNLDELELVRTANKAGISFEIPQYRKIKKSLIYSNAKSLLGYGVDPQRAREYLKKCRAKKQTGADMKLLLDYYGLCKKTDMKLTSKVAFPSDLKREHDRLTLLYNEKSIESKAAGVAEYNNAFKKLARQYAALRFESGGLCIRIAEAPRDLFYEGVMLGHCVGTYVSTHAEGNSCIFLLRKKDAPDKPFFTLQLNMKTFQVIQNRGFKNCARTPEVEAFEKKWLAYIEQYKGLYQKEKARKSA